MSIENINTPLDISDNSDNYIELDTFKDCVDENPSNTEGFDYPSVILTNIVFTDSIDAIRLNKVESNRTFPVWIKTSTGELVNIGTLNITFEMLNLFRILDIGVTLHLDENTQRELNLNDPYVLEEFI